jgi:hypothetical protein
MKIINPWRISCFNGGFSINDHEGKTPLAKIPLATEERCYDEQCANAVLISQAPALLLALKEAEQALASISTANIEDTLEVVRKPLTLLRMGGVG